MSPARNKKQPVFQAHVKTQIGMLLNEELHEKHDQNIKEN